MSNDLLRNIQLVRRPGIIELGWGHPDASLLPVSDMRGAAAAALDRFGADALAYGADRGAGALLAWLCERIARTEGREVSSDAIVLTGGASQGLDLLCTLCTRPGDVALVEAPTYHLALKIMRDYALQVVPIACDSQGMRPDALAETLAEVQRKGHDPRLLYTIPTFHNPTGVCLHAERRVAITQLAAAAGVLIVEDDVYRELAYDGPAPPSLWSIAAPGSVARLGSFAKSLAPGLRLGWITADAGLVTRIVHSGLIDSGGGLNHFTAMVVAAFCADGFFESHVAVLRAAYRVRRDALMQALTCSLPAGCTMTPPAGGYFVWVQLPAGLDATTLLPQAEAAGVAYLPGARFFVDGSGSTMLRLAFSLYAPEELAEGARRLSQVLQATLR